MKGAVTAIVVPCLSCGHRPSGVVLEHVAAAVCSIHRAKVGARVRIEARPQHACQLTRAQRAQHPDLRTLEPAHDLADLFDHLLGGHFAAAAQARRIELDREQDLMVMGDLGALTDQLQV